MIKIACPRIGIEPCSPQEFAAQINAMSEFPETDKTPDQERLALAILSCMVALGGRARCTKMAGGFMAMQSEVGDIALRALNSGEVEIIEFEERDGEVVVSA